MRISDWSSDVCSSDLTDGETDLSKMPPPSIPTSLSLITNCLKLAETLFMVYIPPPSPPATFPLMMTSSNKGYENIFSCPSINTPPPWLALFRMNAMRLNVGDDQPIYIPPT